MPSVRWRAIATTGGWGANPPISCSDTSQLPNARVPPGMMPAAARQDAICWDCDGADGAAISIAWEWPSTGDLLPRPANTSLPNPIPDLAAPPTAETACPAVSETRPTPFIHAPKPPPILRISEFNNGLSPHVRSAKSANPSSIPVPKSWSALIIYLSLNIANFRQSDYDSFVTIAP